jgi:hypothetical protein
VWAAAREGDDREAVREAAERVLTEALGDDGDDAGEDDAGEADA